MDNLVMNTTPYAVLKIIFRLRQSSDLIKMIFQSFYTNEILMNTLNLFLPTPRGLFFKLVLKKFNYWFNFYLNYSRNI